MKSRNLVLVSGLALSCGAAFLQGCVPVAVFGGAASVGMSATAEHGFSGLIDDAAIKAEINALWFDFDPGLNEMVELSVREGRVLLTGAVDTPQRQIDAVRLSWKAGNVKEVIDETTIGDGHGIGSYAGDAWITTHLKAEILFEPEILSVNYNIKTVNGKIYLIGIAQNQLELDRILDISRRIDGVKEVISYVRLKDEPNFMAEQTQETTLNLQPPQSAS